MEFPFKCSFWADETPPATTPLAKDLNVDIAIVGGGYAGMSAAYYLKQAEPKLDICVLEAVYTGYGASGRNFGSVSPGVKEVRGTINGPADLEELRFVTRYYLDLRLELERRIAEANFDCEYRNEPVLEQALDEEVWEGLQRQSEFLTQRGTPHYLLSEEDMRRDVPVPYPTKGGLVRTAWRAAQPYTLARGFRDQLIAMGVRCHENTRVVDLQSGPALATENGPIVKAKQVIFATNAYSEKLDFLKGLIFPRHTYVMATEALKPEIFASLGFSKYQMIQDAGFVFYYSRVYQNRLLLGGGTGSKGFFAASTLDDAADQDTVEFARVYAELERRWPQLRGVGIEAAWGGPVDQSPGFVPFVKPLDGYDGVIVSMGFNGEGIVPANCSGKMAVGLVLGPEKAHADAERVRQIFLNMAREA